MSGEPVGAMRQSRAASFTVDSSAMTVALVSIGTEITRGELLDTNSRWMAERLTELGHHVVEMATVDDHPGRIGAVLQRLAGEHDVLVATGGLGPTTDDLTAAAVAQLQGVPLVRDEEALREVEQRLAERGRVLAPSNAKQADFPAGAEILPNRLGTAPGFAVTLGSARAFFLPGVPAEMSAMFDERVLPRLPPSREQRRAIRLRSFGLPESEVNDRLAGIEAQFDVVLGYRATFPEIEIKVLAAGTDPGDVGSRCRAAADAIRARLGPKIVYGEGSVTLASAVGKLLRQGGLTFGLAESCTGGLVSELVTRVPGSSAYYVGGVCCYANQVKSGVLGVGADTLGDFGAVSEPVARQMAEGARRVLGCDLALAITGIAGPGGGTPEKPVGTVHWAVATPDGTRTWHRVFAGSRDRVRYLSAYAGLASVRNGLIERQ